MLSAVKATLCLSAIHLRINIFKEISEKNVQSKMAAIFSIDRQKGSNCLLDFFIYSTNFEINTNILQQVFIMQNEFLINNYIISQ